MATNEELSAIIRRAMERKNLDQQKLAQALGISQTMAEKLLCGDVVPSHHLEKQMVEVLEVDPSTMTKMSSRGEEKSKAEAALEEKRKRAQKKPEAA